MKGKPGFEPGFLVKKPGKPAFFGVEMDFALGRRESSF
jgi:hypothetical protein